MWKTAHITQTIWQVHNTEPKMSHQKPCENMPAQMCTKLWHHWPFWLADDSTSCRQRWKIWFTQHQMSHGVSMTRGAATSEARKRADLAVPHQKCTTQHAQLHPSLPTPHVNRTALAPNVTPHEHGGWELANKGFTPDQWCHRGVHLTPASQLWGAAFEKRHGTAVRNLPAEREHWHGNTVTRGWTCSATTFFRDAKQHLPF